MVMGGVPSVIEEGFLNKTTGLPDGETSKMTLNVGAIQIPNFSRAWAYQELKNGVPTGELIFYPWGKKHKQGTKDEKECRAVEIRFLKGTTSLDKQYQDNVLKMRVADEDAQISLENGMNDYDELVEGPLILMLKHHTFNKDNKSRDPNNMDILFTEYNPENLNKTEVSQMKRKHMAEQIVLEAEGSTDKLGVLAVIFELDTKAQDEIIFNQLLDEVKKFDQFNKVIEVSKLRWKFILESLQQNGVLEFTDKEAVLKIDDAREFLYKGIPEDIKDKIQFLTENVLEPEVFVAFQKGQEINSKLMEVLN